MEERSGVMPGALEPRDPPGDGGVMLDEVGLWAPDIEFLRGVDAYGCERGVGKIPDGARPGIL